MTRLGIRLALAGGRGTIVLTAVGVALGTAALLLALTIDPAINARAERLAWREPTAFALTAEEVQTRFAIIADGYGDTSITRAVLAGTDPTAPVPPGIPALPRPGESYLSPALADLVESVPADELGDRFGTVVGDVGDAALADPRELVAITGVAPEDMPNALGVTTFEAVGDIPTPLGFLRIALAIGVVGLLAPVAIFVATATRLSAARRAQRFAAVRLAGASPAQARRLAALEALIAGGIGAVVGVAAFFALRPVAALLPFIGHSWFVDDLTPNAVIAAIVVVAVPLVSVAAALYALRDALAAPLFTARPPVVSRLSPARLIPLLLAVGALAGAVALEAANPGGLGDLTLFAIGAAFLALASSLMWAGPYLVSVAARLVHRLASRPATLIASRRLTADARGGFYAISGVVLSVFIGSVFHALVVPVTSSVDVVAGSGFRPAVVSAVEVNLFQVGGSTLEAVRSELAATPGVERVVIERVVELFWEGAPAAASVMSCEDAAAVLQRPMDGCGEADLLAAEPVTAGRYDVSAYGIEPDSMWTATVVVDRVHALPPDMTGLPGLLDPAAIPGGADDVAPRRIIVLTDGSQGAIERARTAIEQHIPTTITLPAEAEAALGAATVTELTWLINFGIGAVMLVAGSTLAISVLAGLMERRRPLGLLRLSGMPMSQLRRMVFIEAAGPLVATSVVTCVIGIAVAQLIARVGMAGDVGLPGLSILMPIAIGVAGGLLVVLTILPFLERATSSEATRFE